VELCTWNVGRIFSCTCGLPNITTHNNFSSDQWNNYSSNNKYSCTNYHHCRTM
jgi:hypothetical protein